MRVDFTQSFTSKASSIYLIIEDVQTEQILYFSSPEDTNEYGQGEAAQTISIDLTHGESIAELLSKELYHRGLILNSFREICRETKVFFSFVDNTPGTKQDLICLHVKVDITKKADDYELAPLEELLEVFQNSLFVHPIFILGVKKLQAERG